MKSKDRNGLAEFMDGLDERQREEMGLHIVSVFSQVGGNVELMQRAIEKLNNHGKNQRKQTSASKQEAP